jgi:hypothetical protein
VLNREESFAFLRVLSASAVNFLPILREIQIENNNDFLCASVYSRVLATAGYVSSIKFDVLQVRPYL